MAVFNAAANQVLAQPVSAFYKGKAMRAQQERAELENRALQREEDYAAENRRMAKQDRERRIAAEDLATEQVKQQIAQGKRDALSYRVNLLAPAINSYTESGDLDALNEYVNIAVRPNLPEADMREFQEMFGDSLDANEAQAAGLLVDVFRKTDGQYKAQNFADASGKVVLSAVEGSEAWLDAVQNKDLFLAGNVTQKTGQGTQIVKINDGDEEVTYEEKVVDGEIVRTEIARAPRRTPGSRSVSFIGDDGQPRMGSYDSDTGIYTDSDGVVHRNATPIAPAATQSEISADPRTGGQLSKDFSDLKKSYDKSLEISERIGNFMPQARALPDAVGGMAKLASTLAAVAELAGGEDLGEFIAENMTSTDQETLSEMRGTLQIIRSVVRPIATGDEGTRQSDQERKIASEIVGLVEKIESPLDLVKNYPQVIGSLRALYAENYVNAYNRVASDTSGALQWPYDLSTDAGLLGLFTELSERQVFVEGQEEKAADLVKRLRNIQNRSR